VADKFQAAGRDDLGPRPGHRLGRDWLAVRALSAAQRQKTISFSPHVHVHLSRPSKISLPARSRTELAPCTLLAPAKAPRKTHPHERLGPSSPCTVSGTHPHETLGVISPCAHPLSRHPSFQFHIDFVLIVLLHTGWASSTTPHSTASDPAEEEALLCLEQGTQKLEEGDVEGAKILYQRSVDIKRNASSLFNLGVTHYHLSSCSFQIRLSLFETQPHKKRSLMKRSILGRLLLSSNHPVQMLIPVRSFILPLSGHLCSTFPFWVQI
jgi:hypothetical protein